MNLRVFTAAIYLRLSKDDGKETASISIENQREILTQYCADNGFIIHDEYIDDGWSGTNFNRPDFIRMMEDADKGLFGIIVVKDASRFGRDNPKVLTYVEDIFPEKDIRLIATNGDIDTGAGENDLFPIITYFNQRHAQDTSRKVKAIKAIQAKKDEYNGSAPYGYRKDPNNCHKLIIDEEAAAVVRRMYEMADAGIGSHQISRIIAEEKIYIPSAYKFYKYGEQRNRFKEEYPYDWLPSTVRRILESRIYVGAIVSQKFKSKSFKNQKLVPRPESEWVTVEGTHEPLVDIDLFDRVGKLIRLKKKANKIGYTDIFHGVLKCADCGSNMSYRPYNGRAGSIGGNFLCNKYKHSKSDSTIQRQTCTLHYTQFRSLNAATLALLNGIIAANISENEVLELLTADKEPQKAVQKELDKAKRRDSELGRIIKKLFEKNALGDITDEQYAQYSREYTTEQSSLRARIQELESVIGAEINQKENVRLFVEQVRKFKESEELTREMILGLIEKIEVHEATGVYREGTREQDIVFHFRYIGVFPNPTVSLKSNITVSQ